MITNETAKSTYVIADGVNTYAIGFQYDYNPDGTPQIQLYLNNHPESPLVYGTDYTLSGDELSVVLLDNYSVGDKLHILRSISMVQLSDYVIGRIDPEQIERDFDESVMRDQQLQAEIDTLSELPIDHEQRITTIEEEIPDAASSSNQLTDKNYVDTQISNHTNRTDNPHTVTAAQVGLGNCDNTADLDKPISTATQNALDLKANSADLATVATSGSYNDLLNTPTLGTAAATDATDYATAAQGGLADTAVQPGDLATVATSGSYADLLNTPTLGTMAAESASDYTPSASLATVATSGAYSDLSGTPTIPTTIAELTGDVNVSTPTAGDHLVFNGTSQKWENTPSSAAVSWGGITGDPKDQTDMLNIANWSNNVTNCVTEIPQDIKLELASDGTLTLKAGSKLYFPNGYEQDGVTKKFDTLVLTEDKSIQGTYGDTIYFESNSSNFWLRYLSDSYSGATAPSVSDEAMWYDTTNNIIKSTFDGQSWSGNGNFSFPICILIIDTNTNPNRWTKINRTFNGFGYIGSTVFALPGVKGLIPNGRNADGSLKNTEWVASQVITSTLTFGAQSYYFGVYNNNQELAFYGKTITKYDEKNNVIIDTHPDPDVIRTGWSFFGECVADSNSKIKAFTPKTVFHALDYSDSTYIANCAMPSDRYIDLTLGASFTSYTMPDDGYLFLYKSADAANQYITISNNTTDLAIHQWVPATGGGCAGYLPVKKGDSVRITYTAGGAVVYFRFIYANGATKEF